jgi:hypothetical protein
MGILMGVKALAFVLMLGVAVAAQADTADDQALIAALVPGSISARPWGWVISTSQGTTHVMRERDGYTITTPSRTFRLIRRLDGFAVLHERQGVRVLPPDAVFDLRRTAARRR